MVNFFEGAASLVAIAAGMPGAGVQMWDNFQKSEDNKRRADDLRRGAQKVSDPGRRRIDDEWGKLDPQYHKPAPTVVRPEAFGTWSHQQIYQALNGADKGHPGVNPAEVNAGGDGWRRIADQAEKAVTSFRKCGERDITQMWSGQSANAALRGTAKYVDSLNTILAGFREVANGISLMGLQLDQAKRSVGPPEKLDAIDEFLGHIPGNGVLKLGKHRSNEATANAQNVMTTVYQPGVAAVDGRTPLLPEIHNPIDGPAGPPGPSSPSTPGGHSPGAPATAPVPGGAPTIPAGDHQPTGVPAGATAPGLGGLGNDAGNPPATTPANATDPASTTPQNFLQDPVGRPGSPSAPGGPGGLGAPDPGGLAPDGPLAPPSQPGNPGQTRSPGAPGMKSPGKPGNSLGRPGMPGMPATGGKRPGEEEDSEHQTPDYLVQDRTTELLGTQPRVLPPGGVIGE